MVPVKSLLMGLSLLALLLCPTVCLAFPVDATTLYARVPVTGGRVASQSALGAHLLFLKTRASDTQTGAEFSQAPREWEMQSATVHSPSPDKTSVNKNVSRIIVPAAGGQKTPDANTPSARGPTLPAWVWALVPITALIVLAAILSLRTIFVEDDSRAAFEAKHDRDERISPQSYESRHSRSIPITGASEPRRDIPARKDGKGRSSTRIRIDDEEPEGRSHSNRKSAR